MGSLTTPNIENRLQNYYRLTSACPFHKRSLYLLSVVPPLLHETAFADESDSSSLRADNSVVEDCARKRPDIGIVRGGSPLFHMPICGLSAVKIGLAVKPVDNFQARHFGFLKCSTQSKSLMATTFYHCFGEAKKAGDIRDLDKNGHLGSFFVPDPCSTNKILQ